MTPEVILSPIQAPGRSGDNSHTLADIVCVHGLGGDPYRTWAALGTSTFWPQTLLSVDVPGLRILTPGHQAQATHFTTEVISQRAENLLRELVEWRDPDQKIGRELIFIAHSSGGIIVKQALVIALNSSNNTYREILHCTLGAVFLSTPHSTRAEDIKKVLQYAIFAGDIRVESDIPGLLRKSVASWQAIQQTFEELHSRKLLNIQVASFFEELPVPGFGLVVDEPSAVPGHFSCAPLYADHETICKFTSSTEPNYQRVLGELKKILRRKVEEPRALNHQEQEFLARLRIDNGSHIANPAYEGTCNWIFEHREFVSWLEQDHSSFLWLKGTAGSGKSTLVKHITQELKHKCLSSNAITASYFFHYSRDIPGRSARELFQSLLFQLLSQIPSVMSDYVPRFQQEWERYSKLGGSGEQREQWLANNLEDLLERSISKISDSHEMCIIIDGLDECSREEAVRVLALFSSIHSKALENVVRLCVSTRLRAYIEPFCFAQHRKIFLPNENCKDIQRFTQRKLERQLRLSIRNPCILESLVKRASGVFLWVSLVVDLLAHGNDTGEISEQMLWAIPSGLDDVYCTILDRLTQNERDSDGLVKKILTWVTFARRPLLVEELQEALQFGALPGFASGALPMSLVTDESSSVSKADKARVITELCWGFVETREYQKLETISDLGMDGETSYLVLRLAHQSARDFLQNANWSKTMGTGSEVASKHGCSKCPDLYIADICLQCLYLHAEASPAAQFVVQQRSKYLLLPYATMYWPEHAKLADRPSSSYQLLLRNLRWPSTRIISHWFRLYQQRSNDNAISTDGGWTVEHAAAAFGLYNLALAMHKGDRSFNVNWDVRDAAGRTPLSWAAAKGHLSIVRLLLLKGASISTRDNRHGLSPLHWAALQGHQMTVELLLEAGADVDDRIGGSTSLAIAAARGHQTVVKVLLENGADPNLIDMHYGQVPLHLAAARGNALMVSHLLDHGANPNILDRFSKRTPLYYATIRSHQEIVGLLLDHGAGVPCSEVETLTGSVTTWADRVIYALLRAPGDLPLCCPRSPDAAPGSGASPPNRGSEAINRAAKQPQKTPAKRGRDGQASGGGDENGGSGDEPNKHPALDLAPLSAGRPTLRLACPYFKYDPGRYGAQKTCRGPDGWPDVHRLKQHLYVRHFAIVCRRCRQIFQSDQGLSEHATAEQACPVQRERNYADGFDEDQKGQLKSRTRKRKSGDELEYWKDVYQILFPEIETNRIPSPFYTDESIDYASYNESCAYTRLHDPELQARLLEMVNDPRLVNGILTLINSHQSAVIRPAVSRGNDSSSTRPDPESAPQRPPRRDYELAANSPYQPTFFGDDEFSYGGPPFSLLNRESRILQPYPHAPDSGFFSETPSVNQPDTYPLPLQSADIAYTPGHLTSHGPRDVRSAPVAEMVTTVVNLGLISQIPNPNRDDVLVDTGVDSQSLSWAVEEDHTLLAGPEQVPNLQPIDPKEQLPLTHRFTEMDE